MSAIIVPIMRPILIGPSSKNAKALTQRQLLFPFMSHTNPLRTVMTMSHSDIGQLWTTILESTNRLHARAIDDRGLACCYARALDHVIKAQIAIAFRGCSSASTTPCNATFPVRKVTADVLTAIPPQHADQAIDDGPTTTSWCS